MHPKDKNESRDCKESNKKSEVTERASLAPVTSLMPELDTTVTSSTGEQKEVSESYSVAIDDLSVEILKPSTWAFERFNPMGEKWKRSKNFTSANKVECDLLAYTGCKKSCQFIMQIIFYYSGISIKVPNTWERLPSIRIQLKGNYWHSWVFWRQQNGPVLSPIPSRTPHIEIPLYIVNTIRFHLNQHNCTRIKCE